MSLVAITFLAYLPAIQGTLVWDDDAHITKPALRSLHGLWRIWFDVHATAQYYPLVHTAFWIEQRLFGGAVLGYHLVNVCLHTAAACLVVVTARRLSLPGAWLAGAIFAVHPVCVESVAWITEQKNTLCAVFSLSAVVVYLRFERDRQTSKYVAATILYVLALLSKTIAATVPAALLVLVWQQTGRVNWKRDVLPLVPWLTAGVFGGLVTEWVENTIIGARGTALTLSPTQHIVLAAHTLCFYFGKLVWPAVLIFSYPHWTLDLGLWREYLYPAVVVAAFVAVMVALRKTRGPLASFLIFTLMLFPALGFLNVFYFRYSYVADHFQYLASLGVLVPIASALTVLLSRYGPTAARPWIVTVPLLAVLSFLTWRQSSNYRDAETLYRATLAKNPASWMAHNNLGNILAQEPDTLPEAIQEFKASLRLKPDNPEAHLDLGGALAHDPDRLPDAIREFRTALKLRPAYADAHFDLGLALSRDPSQLEAAISEYRAALKIDPDQAQVHNNLANLLSRMPNGLEEAIANYKDATRISPDYVEAHFNLGRALAEMPGRKSDAIAEFQTALRLKPDLEPAMEAIAALSTNQ